MRKGERAMIMRGDLSGNPETQESKMQRPALTAARLQKTALNGLRPARGSIPTPDASNGAVPSRQSLREACDSERMPAIETHMHQSEPHMPKPSDIRAVGATLYFLPIQLRLP